MPDHNCARSPATTPVPADRLALPRTGSRRSVPLASLWFPPEIAAVSRRWTAMRLRSLQPFAALVVPVRRAVCSWVGHGAPLAVPAPLGGATNRGTFWVLRRYSVHPVPPAHSGTQGPFHSLRRTSPSHGESAAPRCE